MTTLDKMLQGLANALGASLSTLTTTAKTVVGAINELKSGLTSTDTTVSGHTSTISNHTSTIGSGALDTTSQTLIGAVNELAAKVPTPKGWGPKIETAVPIAPNSNVAYPLYILGDPFTLATPTWVLIQTDLTNGNATLYLGQKRTDASGLFTSNPVLAHPSGSGEASFSAKSNATDQSYTYCKIQQSSTPGINVYLLDAGTYCFAGGTYYADNAVIDYSLIF